MNEYKINALSGLIVSHMFDLPVEKHKEKWNGKWAYTWIKADVDHKTGVVTYTLGVEKEIIGTSTNLHFLLPIFAITEEFLKEPNLDNMKGVLSSMNATNNQG